MNSQMGIKEVAELAGVSVSTVSKVLKNYSSVSDATREKVLKVIKETGYIPNAVASALSSKTNNRIALYIYVNDRYQQIDEINMMYIMGAFDKARELGLELVTIFAGSVSHYTKEESLLYIRSQHVDSVIVFGLNKNDERVHYLLQQGLKLVVVDADITTENVSCVMIDHCRGQYEVAKAITREGDKVLYLAGKKDGYVTDMRLHGMAKLAEERNLKLTVRHGDFSEEKAFEIVRKYGQDYDDIVCASDLMAIGAKNALPSDTKIRLSGFDGIRLMSYVAPDVLTCRQDFYQIGAEALLEAEKLRQGEHGERVIVPYTITTISR